MRFFTREWKSADLSDAEEAAHYAAYAAHRDRVLRHASHTLRQFHTEFSVHDGLIRGVTLDRARAVLRIALRCGDQQVGYRNLDLEYGGVSVQQLDVALFALITRDDASEVLYLEVDTDDGGFVHRWLWAPFDRELDILFRDFSFHAQSVASRDVDRSRAVLQEIGAGAG